MDFSGSVPNSFSKKNISGDFSSTSESIFFWISARFLFLGPEDFSLFPTILAVDFSGSVPNSFFQEKYF